MAVGVFLIVIFFGSITASAEWKTVCNKQKCQLFREIVKAADQTVLARLILQNIKLGKTPTPDTAAKDGNIVGIVSLPLGLYIPGGVNVAIDKKTSFKAALVDCRVQEGCRAAFNMTSAITDAMKRGGNISFSVVDGRSRRSLSFNFSLIGFTVAYDAFRKTL